MSPRLVAPALFVALAASGCGNGAPPGESTLAECSNGRDDDGDGAIDCADVACRVYAFCLSTDAGADAGPIDAAPPPDGAICVRPIDVVITADVSSSMGEELAAMRDRAPAIYERLRALEPDARISLVVFVDDALAVNACEPFADAAALAGELDAWRARSADNRSPESGTYNVDCPENSLDALALAAACPWRAGSARIVVHLTDDTFAERPAVLSGPFGGGIVVRHTYAEAGDALAAASARVLAITRTGQGPSCGAGRSPDVGQGFRTPYQGMATLPERTGGAAADLPSMVDGTLDVAASIAALAETACAP